MAFVVITVLIAYLSLVLGELVPKRIALQRVERVALFTAAPIDFIARLFRPFIVALSFSTNAIVRIFGIDPTAGKESISGEELRDLVAGHEELSEDERNLIDDVFEAGERELREVMLPRTEVDFLEARLPVADAGAKGRRSATLTLSGDPRIGRRRRRLRPYSRHPRPRRVESGSVCIADVPTSHGFPGQQSCP